MVSRFTRAVPVTVNDVLDGHVALDLQCLDRLCMATWRSCTQGWNREPVAEPGFRSGFRFRCPDLR